MCWPRCSPAKRLSTTRPLEADHCGDCRRCLDACPTGALVAPYRLDARRCISYLTIEIARADRRGNIAAAIGQRIFGCDACQEACPWNQALLKPAADGNPVELAELLLLDEEAFRRRFAGTAVLHIGRSVLLCNAAIALGNRPHEPALPALQRGLDDADPLVCEACAWALQQYGTAGKPAC